MKKIFKAGHYLNAWGKAWVVLIARKIKDPDKIMEQYRSDKMEKKITEAQAKRWDKIYNSNLQK